MTQQQRELIPTDSPSAPAALTRSTVMEGEIIEAPFSTVSAFEVAQRMAKCLSTATFVPKEFQNNIGNCIIALELANRARESIFTVVQNINVIHGRPSWSAQYCIGKINGSGLFASRLKFAYVNEPPLGDSDQEAPPYDPDTLGCYAWAIGQDGEEVAGAVVDIRMAKDEGWYNRNGSKWKTMPRQMLMYRAASFFARAHCPEVLMGMPTTDELIEIGAEATVDSADDLNRQLRQGAGDAQADV